jgi:uncharacterized membrane protein
MSHSQRTTLFGIVFWITFLASIGFGFFSRYRWLDVAWFLAVYSLAAIISVFSIVEMFKNRNTSNEYAGRPARSLQSSHYLPRWMMWVLLDDEQYAKYLQRRRVTPSSR